MPTTHQPPAAATRPAHHSPLRYPGGKSWLVPRLRPWFASLTAAAGRQPAELVEPFAGGASVALAAVFEGLVDRAVLVELDPDVAAFWQAVLGGDAPWLADEVAGFHIADEVNVRRVLASRPSGTRRRAFRFLVANRVSRGGVVGPRAGVFARGERDRGLASRWYPDTLRRRLLRIGEHAGRLRFIHGDGLAFMRRHAGRADAAWYIDPPYTAGGKRAGARLYACNDVNHEAVFRLAARLAGPALLTYEHAEPVFDLARRHGLEARPVLMSGAHNAPRTELLIGRDLSWDRPAEGRAEGGPPRHADRVMPLDDIRVGHRYRSNLEQGLGELAASIRRLGLLAPLVVSPDGLLLAGRRRLEALRVLGWREAPVRVVRDLADARSALEVERDENVCRVDPTPSDLVGLGRQLEDLELAAARDRLGEGRRRGGRTAGRGRPKGATEGAADSSRESFPRANAEGRVRDRVGRTLGVSGVTYRRMQAVVEAAEADPKKYGRLRDAMDRTGKVNGVYRRLRTMQQAEALGAEPPPLPSGPFAVVACDPPWQYTHRPGDDSKRNVTPYPAMTLDQLKALPVAELAGNDCALWLWSTNAHLPDAVELVKAWGFAWKTMLTWAKDRMGTGDVLRGQTEHAILALRGRPVLTLAGQSTLLRAARGGHSAKPEEFYALVESLCPGSKVELFARRHRPGWTAWGGPELAAPAANGNGHAGKNGTATKPASRPATATTGGEPADGSNGRPGRRARA